MANRATAPAFPCRSRSATAKAMATATVVASETTRSTSKASRTQPPIFTHSPSTDQAQPRGVFTPRGCLHLATFRELKQQSTTSTTSSSNKHNKLKQQARQDQQAQQSRTCTVIAQACMGGNWVRAHGNQLSFAAPYATFCMTHNHAVESAQPSSRQRMESRHGGRT